MKKWYVFFATLIVIFGFSLRLFRFAERAPFDWDQNRDYQVISGITSRKMTLIGPVAKGEGGFFLGPLYYYLATPAFVLMGGNPRALPLTSITLDMLAVVAMLGLLPSVLGKKQTLLLAALWSCSWFAIEMSRISWNVALIPLWSVMMLWVLSGKEKLSYMKVLLLGVLAGLTWHVHAALIPLTPLIILFSWKRLGLTLRAIPLLGFGYLIPLLPLLFFNFRHAGLEWYLITALFTASSRVGFDTGALLSAMFLRLGKNTQALLTGIANYNLWLGYLTFALGIIGLWLKRPIDKVAGLFLTINFLAVAALHESGFPEYYFAASYIPTLILLLSCFTTLMHKRYMPVVGVIAVLFAINLKAYSWVETSFALSQKEKAGLAIAGLDSPVDLRLELVPGREGGITPIFLSHGGKLEPNSPLKVVVSDKGDGPLYINGELTTDLGHFGGFRVATVTIDK